MFLVSHLLHLFHRNLPEKPRGCYLLRYYKAGHRGRIIRALQQAQIEHAISIADTVDRVPGKIGVYCRCDMREAESLFFQHYALVKQDERSRTAARPAVMTES